MMANTEATQEEVNEVVSALSKAIDSLEKKPVAPGEDNKPGEGNKPNGDNKPSENIKPEKPNHGGNNKPGKLPVTGVESVSIALVIGGVLSTAGVLTLRNKNIKK